MAFVSTFARTRAHTCRVLRELSATGPTPSKRLYCRRLPISWYNHICPPTPLPHTCKRSPSNPKTLPYPTLPYPTLPYPTLPYLTLPYPTIP